ncbi:MAG: glycosyltransferase [candidate division WOR-3 bacterium]|nr:glycosyltransferase [candidate division WOR-3 bacterium]
MNVSIIIPVYNGKKFILNAVNSALKQTYKDIEIIVVDDHSTDGTYELIKDSYNEYIKSGIIKVIRNERNMERSYSRNIGFKNSSGKYVFFLDYDDEWKENYIQESLEKLQHSDIVYSIPRIFIDESGKIRKVSKRKYPKDIDELIFSAQIAYPSATSFKREKFIYFNENYSQREDWELFLRARLQGLNIEVIDNYKVMIRSHNNRTSIGKSFLEHTLKVYREYESRIPKKYYSYFLFHIADTLLRYGRLKDGWKLLFKSIKLNPKILLNSRRIGSILKRGFRIRKI